MEENIEVKVAAAILKFLQQHELQKTAKALLKEAGRRVGLFLLVIKCVH